MIIDLEHHWMPFEVWEKRGGKTGQVVRMVSADGKIVRPLTQANYDIPIHLKFMDAAGIDISVLSVSSVDSLEEAKFCNDKLAEIVRQYPDRFIGFASTVPLEGKPALDELERAVKTLGLKGVLVMAQIDDAHALDCREMWLFYEKVSQLGIPIFVHVSLAGKGFEACNAPYDLNRTLVREFSLATATARICLGGVLEEFPDLRFIVSHFGGGISSIKERLDRYIRYWGELFWTGKPLISEPYAQRFNEHFNKIYFNMAGREIGLKTVKCALTNISPRRLVFGTDFPYNFVDDPAGVRTYISEIRKLGLDKESIEAMLGTNAIGLLRLQTNDPTR